MMLMSMAIPSFGAIETVSESFVGSTVTIPGAQTGGERISLFSLRAVRPALYAGRVSAVGATTITDSGANWAAVQFAGRGALYAEFDSGVEGDIQQVSFASKTLSFSGPLPPTVTAGTRFRIREHHTVAKLFGSANQAGLLPGANSDVAEQILHFIPETQQPRIYFYLSFNGITGWMHPDYSSASNVVIYPEQGLMLKRLTTHTLTLTWSGPMKPSRSILPILPGHNLLGVYNRSMPVRLDQLNLVTGNAATGFAPGPNADTGDNLIVLNPAGPSIYFYLNFNEVEGWYDSGYQPAAHITLAPGTAFFVYRRPPAQNFDWTLLAQ